MPGPSSAEGSTASSSHFDGRQTLTNFIFIHQEAKKSRQDKTKIICYILLKWIDSVMFPEDGMKLKNLKKQPRLRVINVL